MANIQKVEDFKNLINTRDMVKRMTTSCGGKEQAGQFMASMLDLFENDTALQNCDPRKVVEECVKAASLNLPLVKGLGFAYVVPYKNVPTFTVGYRGLIQLALRSGQYISINADAVYEGEQVVKDRMTGLISITGNAESGRAIGYFAYFKLVNGFEKCLYMTVEELEEYARKYSPACRNGLAGPWKNQFPEMCKKTLIRRIMKYGPMTAEMQKAASLEVQAAEAAAAEEIQANANTGPVVGEPEIVSVQDMPATDPETGEVVSMEPDF